MQRRDFLRRASGLFGLAAVGALPLTRKEVLGTLWTTAKFKPDAVVENGSTLTACIPEYWSKYALAVLDDEILKRLNIQMQYDEKAQGTRVSVDLLCGVADLDEGLSCL